MERVPRTGASVYRQPPPLPDILPIFLLTLESRLFLKTDSGLCDFFAQEQVAACCLDARNVPGVPGIPPIEHDKAWAIVAELCVKVINEARGAEDAHTHDHTNDGTSDFMSTAAASLTTPLHLMSAEIARREIQVWKSQTIPLPKTSNLLEWNTIPPKLKDLQA